MPNMKFLLLLALQLFLQIASVSAGAPALVLEKMTIKQ
jgi:hypothetical protein